MQRRGGSGQPTKGQRTSGPKARKAPTVHGSTDHSPKQVDRLKHQRHEALGQLAPPSEVPYVISTSPGKLEPVFHAMLANAPRLCDARFGVLYLCDGDAFRAVALSRDAPLAYVEARRREPV